MHVGVLVELAGRDFGLKGILVEKVVVDGIDFTAAGGARCGGDYALDLWQLLEHTVANSRFPATCRTGDDDEVAGLHVALVSEGDAGKEEAVGGENPTENAWALIGFIEPFKEIA